MDRYFLPPIGSCHTCRCAHEAFAHVASELSNYCYFEGPCNIKSCRCDMYDPYIIFISEKTEGFQTMDYLFYEIGLNIIPANAKKMSYNALLDEWTELPIPDSTFNFWKRKGYFKKSKRKLNYGIIIGQIHRGNNKGKFLKNMDINFDINKGTAFVPVYDNKQPREIPKQKD